MFAKPFKVKSNTVMKGSDRRKLRADAGSSFPALSPDNLSDLMPPKEELNVVKVYAHKGESLSIYVHSKNPIWFELERNLYPTVYTLWTFPDLLPAFTTWPPVLEKMAGGADLMLPGVVVPSTGLPEVLQGQLCAVNLVGSRAPVAVGVATMSTREMLASGMKGKGVNILHTYKDQLWASGDKSGPPVITAVITPMETEAAREGEQEEQLVSHNSVFETSIPETQLENLYLVEVAAEACHKGEDLAADERHETQDSEDCHQSPQEVMDNLLNQCFFHALKFKVKKSDLPLLTSTFLRNYLFSCCPEGQQVDIKKSSYKKLSKFLQVMQQRKILQVKELSKGVESIVAVDWKHPDIRSYVASVSEPPAEDMDGGAEHLYQPPEILTLYGISAKMLPLFQESGHRKGDLLTQSDVRSMIISYVKTNELVHPGNKNFVTVNPVICDCLLDKSEQHDITFLKWDDMVTRCLERMQHSYQVTFPGCSPVIRKGNIEHIDISVAQRGSNKKVTMIKNLESYGLDPSSFASLLQQRVQASATCAALPGAKDRVQVQIQGNQVSQIGKLLLEHFKIPRKYVNGLDLSAKSSKKK
ncbi:eukaryotic translation initiation factor 2D [Bufo gargarizans]|uniref:eukaryotic translation initiation factor 2D n=1 Tax=Bufo gargarizans TaxID=30331 RepID=UPI001CF3F7E4|nr:eukaryotic translation initiation factor 2D [Bufo gargarizans]